MTQVTWRAPDELVERVRSVAAAEGRSLNDYLTRVLRAATDPDLAGDGASRLRERLARAGLLAQSSGPRQPPDEDRLAAARRAADTLAVSAIARVEVPAALWRKHRIGQLTAADTAVLIAAFDSDYCGTDRTPPRFAAVAVTATLLDDAARCAAVHGLRAHDAVHLAGARATADVEPDCTTFAAFDRELRAAAAAEGFAVVPA